MITLDDIIWLDDNVGPAAVEQTSIERSFSESPHYMIIVSIAFSIFAKIFVIFENICEQILAKSIINIRKNIHFNPSLHCKYVINDTFVDLKKFWNR
jgi:hypothetical protein